MFSLQPPRHISTLPIATNFLKGPDVSFRGQAEVGGAAGSAASVENDPHRSAPGKLAKDRRWKSFTG
jgi:hypothetical protein